jgi:peptidoglycan/LPS O-acetylase OafA/YrhL
VTLQPARVEGRAFHVPALDGVRALAFLLVFFSHVPGLKMVPGGFAVTVFFFLSGYLITSLLRLEYASTGRIDVPAFFARRALRIAPPYYLTLGLLLLLAAVGAFGDAVVLWQGALAQAGFLANYWVAAFGKAGLVPGSEVYWSLAVEEHYYLVFPFVAAGLLGVAGPRQSAWVLLLASGVVLAVRSGTVLVLPSPATAVTYMTHTRLDGILLGAVVALACNPAFDRPGPLLNVLTAPWASGVAAVGIALTLLPREPLFRETVRYTLQGLLLAPLYCGLIARPHAGVARVLAHPALRWVGALSYTLYLVHDAALHLAREWLPGAPLALAAALALAGSVLYAEAIRRWIERPLARRRAALRAAMMTPATGASR